MLRGRPNPDCTPCSTRPLPIPSPAIPPLTDYAHPQKSQGLVMVLMPELQLATLTPHTGQVVHLLEATLVAFSKMTRACGAVRGQAETPPTKRGGAEDS